MEAKKIIIIHDGPMYADSLAGLLEDIGEYKAKAITTVKDVLDFVKGGKLDPGRSDSINCILIHKDLGQYSHEKLKDVDDIAGYVIKEIHQTNPLVRIGVVSGEYPDGEKHVV